MYHIAGYIHFIHFARNSQVNKKLDEDMESRPTSVT